MRVTAASSGRFDGAVLLEALRAESLMHGRYDIFHRLHADGRPIFSVASLKEPGRFDLQAMPATHYPGVALFAVLPGPVAAAEAFDEMLFTARALATHLAGVMGDERGVPLTAARITALREEVLEFERAAGST
jgi:cell division protein ZipA